MSKLGDGGTKYGLKWVTLLRFGGPGYLGLVRTVGLGSWEGRMGFVESRLLSPNDRPVNPGSNKGDPRYQVPPPRVNFP